MAIADEALTSRGQLATALAVGLESIDRNQTITFTEYTKTVLSRDGYVFWIATGNTAVVNGSLHYMTDQSQDEDQTIGINRMIFTAESEITEFNSIDATTLWVGAWEVATATLQVAFSQRGSLYEQSDIWHYQGFAVYPALSAQLLASINDLPVEPIVSNSLPIWLSQNSMAPVYASYLVPSNIVPPYIVAHIEPRDTIALQAFPVYTWPGVTQPGTPDPFHALPSNQLMMDKVRLTLYGFTNQQAIQYMAALEDYSLNTDAFGFMNSPAIQDDKRTQSEISAIAQKKTITIHASYYMQTADAIQRRLILSATTSIIL